MKYITAYFCAVIFIGDNMEKEIAIIIPAYNAHDTIERLLFSILNQSVKDICRVYLIDDYSEKDYFYLIDKFPWLDMVICRLDENGGPGVARNKGLELVIEDNIPYIVFADADDCFEGYISIEVLYKQILIQENDFIISRFYDAQEDFKYWRKILDCDVWLFGKMYKTEIIKNNNIVFMKIPENEDVCFNLWYFLCSKKTCSIPDVTYCWLFNENSITRKNNGEYTNYCGIGLIKNLIPTYKHIFNNENIPEEKVLSSLANRFLRSYLNYRENYLLWDEETKNKNFQAIQVFYNEIYSIKESFITKEIFDIEWKYLLKDEPHYPNDLTFNNFIKKIREE